MVRKFEGVQVANMQKKRNDNVKGYVRVWPLKTSQCRPGMGTMKTPCYKYSRGCTDIGSIVENWEKLGKNREKLVENREKTWGNRRVKSANSNSRDLNIATQKLYPNAHNSIVCSGEE